MYRRGIGGFECAIQPPCQRQRIMGHDIMAGSGMKCFSVPLRESAVPGYRETRRYLLLGAAASVAGCLASPRNLFAALEDRLPESQLQRFLDASAQRALEMKGDVSAAGQDAYVNYLADTVGNIESVSTENLGSKSWKGMEPGVFLGDAGRNRAFFVVHWRLEPGAVLPPHCHPRTSVCTLGLDGSSTLRHFTVEAGAPSYREDRSSEFLIRQTRQIELRAGTISTLTEHRDNIHLFEGGKKGARGIDVTTDYGGDGSFSFLDFDHRRPAQSSDDLYRARWTGTLPPE